MKLKKKKQQRPPQKKIKATPAAVIASFMGLGLIGLGLYEGLVNGKNGAYYMVFLGVLFWGGVGTAFLKR